jgi:hypothetical protein
MNVADEGFFQQRHSSLLTRDHFSMAMGDRFFYGDWLQLSLLLTLPIVLLLCLTATLADSAQVSTALWAFFSLLGFMRFVELSTKIPQPHSYLSDEECTNSHKCTVSSFWTTADVRWNTSRVIPPSMLLRYRDACYHRLKGCPIEAC